MEIMTTSTFRRMFHLVALSLLLCACWGSQARAQSLVVMVNGDPITSFDVEQRAKLIQISTHKKPTRQQVINELIDEKLEIKEARKYGVNPTGAEIDASYATMGARMHMTADQLTKSLAAQGLRPETLKSRIRAEMVWGSLVRGRFKESLLVSEKEVEAALRRSGDDQSKIEGFEYQMRPIVLIVPRGSPGSVMEARRKEAETLRNRIQSCAEADNLLKITPNATIRDTVTKSSSDLPAPLRELLDKTPVGHLTPPEVTQQGIEMAALCGKKATTVDTPKKKELRQKMFQDKFERRSKAYLEELRKSAMIEYPNGAPKQKGK